MKYLTLYVLNLYRKLKAHLHIQHFSQCNVHLAMQKTDSIYYINVDSNQIYFMMTHVYVIAVLRLYSSGNLINSFESQQFSLKEKKTYLAHILTHLPIYLMHIHITLLSKLPSNGIFTVFLIFCVLSRGACHLFWFCVFIMADQLSLYLMDLGNTLMRLTEPNLFLWQWGKIFDGLESNFFESWIVSRCKEQLFIQIVRIYCTNTYWNIKSHQIPCSLRR